MEADGIALVTGASRGIGRALALELARRGFEVVATMRDPRDGAGLLEASERAGLRLRVARLDVTEPESIAMPDGLRVLVNNAGVEAAHLPLEHTPAALWRTLFETNLFGLVEVTRRALPELRAGGGGVVCNVTSCSILVPMPLFAAYRASKAAVSALGESLRVEVAPFGIRVLEVLPGAIATDMFATSRHVPEAASCPGYEPLAARVHAAREGSAAIATPAEAAAAAIADAILDDDAPLRMGCDPMGAGLLTAWRRQDDEALMRPMLDLFGGR
jgi:NAD(P)-dependent dehydrogenase (short-subunit alcohol dehydrogenase family)